VRRPFWVAVEDLAMLVGAVICFSLFITLAFGCTAQKPALTVPTVQIVDNSQTTIIQGAHNRVESVATNDTTATPEVRQDAEQTTKSGMWIVWLALIATATVGVYFAWRKWIKK
jgi:hypothetical protein